MTKKEEIDIDEQLEAQRKNLDLLVEHYNANELTKNEKWILLSNLLTEAEVTHTLDRGKSAIKSGEEE